MSRRRAFPGASLALAALIAAAGPPAASAQDLGLSVLAGVHSGRESGFRDIYGAAIPVGLELRFMTRRIGFSIGGFTIGAAGAALSPDGGAENYPVKIRMKSFPATAFLRVPWGRAGFDLGFGAVRTTYKETWFVGGFRAEGSAWGFLLGLNTHYDLTPRLALSGSVRILSVPTGRDSLFGGDIDLGGFQALAGVTYRLWGKK
jgi:hypothetical protein